MSQSVEPSVLSSEAVARWQQSTFPEESLNDPSIKSPPQRSGHSKFSWQESRSQEGFRQHHSRPPTPASTVPSLYDSASAYSGNSSRVSIAAGNESRLPFSRDIPGSVEYPQLSPYASSNDLPNSEGAPISPLSATSDFAAGSPVSPLSGRISPHFPSLYDNNSSASSVGPRNFRVTNGTATPSAASDVLEFSIDPPVTVDSDIYSQQDRKPAGPSDGFPKEWKPIGVRRGQRTTRWSRDQRGPSKEPAFTYKWNGDEVTFTHKRTGRTKTFSADDKSNALAYLSFAKDPTELGKFDEEPFFPSKSTLIRKDASRQKLQCWGIMGRLGNSEPDLGETVDSYRSVDSSPNTRGPVFSEEEQRKLNKVFEDAEAAAQATRKRLEREKPPMTASTIFTNLLSGLQQYHSPAPPPSAKRWESDTSAIRWETL